MLICVGIRAHVAKMYFFPVVTTQHTHMGNTWCIGTLANRANTSNSCFFNGHFIMPSCTAMEFSFSGRECQQIEKLPSSHSRWGEAHPESKFTKAVRQQQTFSMKIIFKVYETLGHQKSIVSGSTKKKNPALEQEFLSKNWKVW